MDDKIEEIIKIIKIIEEEIPSSRYKRSFYSDEIYPDVKRRLAQKICSSLKADGWIRKDELPKDKTLVKFFDHKGKEYRDVENWKNVGFNECLAEIKRKG